MEEHFNTFSFRTEYILHCFSPRRQQIAQTCVKYFLWVGRVHTAYAHQLPKHHSMCPSAVGRDTSIIEYDGSADVPLKMQDTWMRCVCVVQTEESSRSDKTDTHNSSHFQRATVGTTTTVALSSVFQAETNFLWQRIVFVSTCQKRFAHRATSMIYMYVYTHAYRYKLNRRTKHKMGLLCSVSDWKRTQNSRKIAQKLRASIFTFRSWL